MANRPAIVTLALIALGAGATATYGQTPRVAPDSGFVFHDERQVDRFVVQRWVSEDAPGISPSGFCDCITLVYEGGRRVLDLGRDGLALKPSPAR
jgi:hypothetical protein